MRDPKNEAGKKDLRHPGKRDGKVLKEEVVKSMAEDTTNMGDIDAARSESIFFKEALTARYADTTNITTRASNQ